MGVEREHLFAVYGASGHTGRFVIDELERHGACYRAVGRDRIHSFKEYHVAALDDPAALSRAFDGASAVINCAGPFLDTAEPVIRATMSAGAHYLDVTAEQQSARSTFENFDRPAKERGLALVPAAGFFGGLADLLAGAALGDWSSADAATIAVYLDSWRPTGGTRATGRRNNFPRVVVRRHELVPAMQSSSPGDWNFRPPVGLQPVAAAPLSEIITVARHAAIANVDSLMNSSALAELADPTAGAPEPVDERGRSSQQFVMEILVEKSGQARRVVASGPDIYAISASLIVQAAMHAVAKRSEDISGGMTLSELCPPEQFLNAVTDSYPGFRFSRVVGARR